jgi:DNA topoisomerase VI subunit A
VYDAGVRLGARKEWEFMWGKYQREIVAEEKKKLLNSLTASREAWLLQRLVKLRLVVVPLRNNSNCTCRESSI